MRDNEKYCPMCELKLADPIPFFCNQCGWDLKHDITRVPLLHETPEDFIEEYNQRLSTARRIWKERLEVIRRLEEVEEEAKQKKTEQEEIETERIHGEIFWEQYEERNTINVSNTTQFFCSKCGRFMCFAHRDRHTTMCKECADKIQLETQTEAQLRDKKVSTFSSLFSKGQLVNNKYSVIELIGSCGGERFVYLCEDITNKSKLVLKLYYPAYSPNRSLINKLIKVKHENIINVLEYGDAGEKFYVVTEYAEGGTLLDRLKERAVF